MHEVFFEKFVSSFESAPKELILDFDCTDDRVHGGHRDAAFTVTTTTFVFCRCMFLRRAVVGQLSASEQD